MSAAERDHPIVTGIIGSIVVIGAFRSFFVKDSVRMHAVTLRPVVFEKYLNGVPNFGVQYRPEKAQVLPFRCPGFHGCKG